jgi:putative FmdB family regulatory protein
MPTYDYRCPNGHDFEHFYRKISDATAELACPQCGAVANRRMSAGAGLVFKGSGFYLTDYGKNAHRNRGADGASSGGESKGESKGDSKGDSGSDAKPTATPDSAKGDAGAANAKTDGGSASSAKSEARKGSETKSSSAKSSEGDSK